MFFWEDVKREFLFNTYKKNPKSFPGKSEVTTQKILLQVWRKAKLSVFVVVVVVAVCFFTREDSDADGTSLIEGLNRGMLGHASVVPFIHRRHFL